jgi:predicted phosphodiesterase
VSYIRAFIPDSHGSFIDEPAAKACIADLKKLSPKQIVMLGDHVDASGIFSTHENNYIDDMDYSYAEDCAKANWFLDEIQKAAPRAEIHYLFGNHESHVERTIARTHRNSKDAKWALALQSPAAALKLKSRGIRWYESNGFYNGLSIRGTIKLGRTYATHGVTAAKHAASVHSAKFGVNIVFGHCHRAQSYITRSIASDVFGAWCPGTLAKLQPLYLHTGISEWSHGWDFQIVEPDQRFAHVHVPIVKGKSLMSQMLKNLR